MSPEFTPFPKMARLFRDVIITEKIDGTNAQIYIFDTGGRPCPKAVWECGNIAIMAGSRNRWITPEDDNFEFAAWVRDNAHQLVQLGAGRHFGEWWGQGIQRGYGLKEKRFSLFNVQRWCLHDQEPQQIQTADPRIVKMQDVLPECVGLVPALWRGNFSMFAPGRCLEELRKKGSVAAPGFMDPEGIVVFHTAGNVGFKATIKNDDQPKGKK